MNSQLLAEFGHCPMKAALYGPGPYSEGGRYLVGAPVEVVPENYDGS